MESISGLIFLLLAVCIGYLSAVWKLVDKTAVDVLPQLLFNICYPAMILETFASIDTQLLLGSGLRIAVATVVVTLILLSGCLLLFRKLPPQRRALYTFLAGVGNVTFVAIPMFQVFLPTQAVLVAILHGASQDPLIWGIYNPLLVSSQSREAQSLKKILTNPCLLATFVGLILVLCKVPVSTVLLDTVSRISAMTAPLALLLIGMLIHQYGLFSWIRDRAALYFSVIRVLLFPLVIGLCLLPFLGFADAALLAILFGTPAPLMAVAWATRAKSQEEFTIHCFLASTLLYLLVMTPALILLVNYL